MISNKYRIEKSFLRFTPIKKFAFIILIASFGFSFVSTVWSIFIKSFLNDEVMVGLVSSIFVLFSFVAHFYLIPFIEKSSKSKLFMIGSLLIGIGYFIYSFIDSFIIFMFLELIITISLTLRIVSSGLLIKQNSPEKKLSEKEGLVYTIWNFAWVIGPLMAGYILAFAGIKMVFILASLFILLSSIIFRFSKIKDVPKKNPDSSFWKNFKDFFKSKNRVRIYLLGAGVSFWWSLIYIYMPLMIIKHLQLQWVGYFIFAVAVPLIFFEYRFGKLAGKIGFKKMFFAGFFIPAILSFLCFLFFSNFILVLVLLILASVGLAMVESNTETYFFDLSKGETCQRFYSPYNTAIDIGNLMGRFIPAVVLYFSNFKFIFLVYSIGCFILSIISLKTIEIFESKKK